MDAGIDFLAKIFHHPVKQRVCLLKVHLIHNCNALTNLNCNFVPVIFIDINPGHVELFGIYLRVQVLIPWPQNSHHFREKSTCDIAGWRKIVVRESIFAPKERWQMVQDG